MLALALAYATLGVSPIVRGALYGLGPVVLGIVRQLAWARAVIQGIAPGVIGVMAVALARMAPPAVPDPLAVAVLLATVAVLVLRQVSPLKAILGGAVVGVLRSRFCEFPAVRAALCVAPWGR